MPAPIKNNAAEIQIASLFAKAVYGDDNVGDFDFVGAEDYGYSDLYQGYLNSATSPELGRGTWNVRPGDLSELYSISPIELLAKAGPLERSRDIDDLTLLEQARAGSAEALIAEGMVDGRKTLVYAARGTGKEDVLAAAAGQSTTLAGNRGQYKLHQEWIDAAIAYAEDPHNGIEAFIVTGHSMGGGVVDQFAIHDSFKVDPHIDLTMVAFGSAGLAPGRYADLGGRLNRMDDYIGISHTMDPVTYPEAWPDNLAFWSGDVEIRPKVRALDNNWNPSDHIYKITVPHINGEPTAADFGQQHRMANYFTHTADIANDPLLGYISTREILLDGDANSNLRGDYSGRGAKDFILGMGGDDTIVGLRGNDVLSGGDGNDRIYGSQGHDVLHGGRGNNILYGESGTDLAVYRDFAEGRYLEVDLHSGDAFIKHHRENGPRTETTDRLSSIERVDATNEDDAMRGSGADNRFRGFDGDDYLDGISGEDLLEGGKGDDTLQGGSGKDVLRGGDGDDVLIGDAPSGFEGSLMLMQLNSVKVASQYAGIGNYGGALTYDAFTLEMLLRPGAGPTGDLDHFPTFASYHTDDGDQLVVRASPVALQGRTFVEIAIKGQLIETDIPADILFDGGLHRLSIGYSSTDGTVRVVVDDAVYETTVDGLGVLGSGGTLMFGQEQDRVGGRFNDFETYRGGMGDIRVWSGLRTVEEIQENAFRLVDGDSEGLSANWRAGAEGTTEAPTDSAGGRGLSYTKHRTNDPLPTNSSLDFADEADVLEGGNGNDRLEGGVGADTLDGGAGIDIAVYETARASVTADLALILAGNGDAAGDIFELIEGLTGSRFDDHLGGNAGDNALNGGGGDDLLEGREGDDRIEGGADDDRLKGQDGADWLEGGTGNDRMWGGIGNDTMIGGEGRDRFKGGSGADSLRGGDDHDRLKGEAGNDEIFGENRNDRAWGGNGRDDMYGGDGKDRMKGQDGDDRLWGEEGKDRIFGGEGNDTLDGGADNDKVGGDAGQDQLDGGLGDDTLSGGEDADVFIFSAGADVITDFEDGIDTLLLDRNLWTGDLTIQEVMDIYASPDAGDTVFDFQNGATLRLTALADPDLLLDDINFI